jgi:hypothetical protein
MCNFTFVLSTLKTAKKNRCCTLFSVFMSLSPEYASDISSEFRTHPNVNALSLPVDHHSPLRRSGRSRSNEQDSPLSDSKAKRMRQSNLRLPRGVQRQSRNGAAYSGWVTVEGYR